MINKLCVLAQKVLHLHAVMYILCFYVSLYIFVPFLIRNICGGAAPLKDIFQEIEEKEVLSDRNLSLEEVYLMLKIHTIFVSFYINRGTFWSVPYTCPCEHPDSVIGPFHELVNNKFSG